MAGRSRMPREVFDYRRGFVPEMPVAGASLVRPIHPHPALLEEEIEIRHVELCRLLGENQRLMEDRISLDRELGGASEELRHLNLAIAGMHAKHEIQSRELVERCWKLEGDLHDAESLKSEAAHLRAEVHRLNANKQDLLGKLQSMTPELEKLRTEYDQLPVLRSDIDGLHQELLRARTAIDYERNLNHHLMEQRKALESNMVTMARELEKLRANFANSGARSWSTGGPQALAFTNLTSNTSNYPNSNGSGYEVRQGAVEKESAYITGSTSWGGYGNSWMGHH